MTQFLHLPSQRVIHNPAPRRVRAYRRSSNFVELTNIEPDDIDEDASDSLVLDSDVPVGTISEVLEWAGDDPARRAAALIAELKGKRRVTLVSELRRLLVTADD